MQLFYHPDITEETNDLHFSKEESHHIANVLRKQVGDLVYITNGKGQLFRVVITEVTRKRCVARIEKTEDKEAKGYRIHLAVAPTKMNDRYEWFLEKATEIGIDEITPIICKHSERKVIKPARLHKVIQSAMKQSLQCYLPVLNDAISFSDFIKTTIPGKQFIAHCESGSQRVSIKNLIKPGEDIVVLIGPEGDFSNDEIKLALQQGYKAVSLGKNRLRTETAAVAACHAIAFINE